MNDELRYSAEGLRSCVTPPGGGQATRVRDVLLVTISHVDGDASLGEEFGAHPPVEAAELGRSLILGTVAAEEIALIQNACSPRGHFFHPHGHDGVRYAFWRDVTEHTLSDNGLVASGWDDDQTIFTAVALSRWIRDSAAGTELAARHREASFEVRGQVSDSRGDERLERADHERECLIKPAAPRCELGSPDGTRNPLGQVIAPTPVRIEQTPQARCVNVVKPVASDQREAVGVA